MRRWALLVAMLLTLVPAVEAPAASPPPALVGVNRLVSQGSGSVRVRLEQNATFTFVSSWGSILQSDPMALADWLLKAVSPIPSHPHDLKIQTPGRFAHVIVQRISPTWWTSKGGEMLWTGYFAPYDCADMVVRPLFGCAGYEWTDVIVGEHVRLLPTDDMRFSASLPAGEYVIGILADGDVPVRAEFVLDDLDGSQDLALTEPLAASATFDYHETAIDNGNGHASQFTPLLAPSPSVSMMGMIGSHGRYVGERRRKWCINAFPSPTRSEGHWRCMLKHRAYGTNGNGGDAYAGWLLSHDDDPGPIGGSFSANGPLTTDHQTLAWLLVWPWVSA